MGALESFQPFLAINRALAARRFEEAFQLIAGAGAQCCKDATGATLFRRDGRDWQPLASAGQVPEAGAPPGAQNQPHDGTLVPVATLERGDGVLVIYGRSGAEAADSVLLGTLADQMQIALQSADAEPAGYAGKSGRRELQNALNRAEEALAAIDHERRKLEAVMQAAPAGILLVEGPGMRVVYTNQLARQMCHGLDLSRPIAEHSVHFLKGDGTPYSSHEMPGLRALIGGEHIRNEEMTFVDPDGETKVLEVNASPVRMEYTGVSYAVVALQDITERKRTEGRIRESRRMLEMRSRHLRRVNEELQQFAYVVSHDLKAPLRAVSNLATWVEEDIGDKLSAENRKQMDMLRSRVKRMDALINALLEYSRAGRGVGRVEPTDTGALVREVINSMSLPRAFVVEVASDMPTVETDRLHLSQVFANLISNAIKHHHAPEQGRILIGALEQERHYEFSVEDNGPGIAPEYHEKVFEMFQSLDGGRKAENTGIGLALIRKLVQNSGGEIRVEENLLGGATFRFTWPKKSPREEASS